MKQRSGNLKGKDFGDSREEEKVQTSWALSCLDKRVFFFWGGGVGVCDKTACKISDTTTKRHWLAWPEDLNFLRDCKLRTSCLPVASRRCVWTWNLKKNVLKKFGHATEFGRVTAKKGGKKANQAEWTSLMNECEKRNLDWIYLFTAWLGLGQWHAK